MSVDVEQSAGQSSRKLGSGMLYDLEDFIEETEARFWSPMFTTAVKVVEHFLAIRLCCVELVFVTNYEAKLSRTGVRV